MNNIHLLYTREWVLSSCRSSTGSCCCPSACSRHGTRTCPPCRARGWGPPPSRSWGRQAAPCTWPGYTWADWTRSRCCTPCCRCGWAGTGRHRRSPRTDCGLKVRSILIKCHPNIRSAQPLFQETKLVNNVRCVSISNSGSVSQIFDKNCRQCMYVVNNELNFKIIWQLIYEFVKNYFICCIQWLSGLVL